MYSLAMKQMVERFNLKNLTPSINLDGKVIQRREINRPALQLTGYYEYFTPDRVQLIGRMEYSYLASQTPYRRRRVWQRLFENHFPCLILCRGLSCFEEEGTLQYAVDNDVPVFQTEMATTDFMAELIHYLNRELAPRISLHGVLVDIYGEGVLIMGESGIGKSEAALELIRRGHRLVADDVVEIKRISDRELLGYGPEVLRYFIELRGIGILNAKELFGVEAVKLEQNIDMVINIEAWSVDKQYDRLGLTEETMSILGNRVISYNIPVRPGRNLAVIAETAAINHRQKKLGYNAVDELNNRVNGNIARRRRERDSQQP